MAAPTEPKKPGTAESKGSARQAPLPVELYRSSIGKKVAMAVSGAFLMFYVLMHMIGNLKLYLGPEHMDEYAEWLTVFGAPAVPEYGFLWIMRVALLAAFLIHIHAAWSLTMMNRRARIQGYEQKRDYIAADYASRTMRWTGVIVLLFVVYHILHFTTGTVHPDFVRHAVYDNVVLGFQKPLNSVIYIVANLALGAHLYHGAYSLFRSLGASNPRFEAGRRAFATVFALAIVIGNVSFPVAVLTGIID
ncbi:MAG TPA: succinate dehydrogenase cytochrome b subunit [Acidimicrobiales bacterium]|nr:succinate dehydrogenase cytochrome b subunit [Acidimicrobiales bacterium]